MQLDQIHPGAVVAAALSTFVLGGLWYSPVMFGKAWMRANGFTEEGLRQRPMARTFTGAAILSLIMALNLAFFLADPETDVVWGVAAGALAGVGWVAAAVTILALFEQRSWRYIAINAGYQAAAFITMGAILGAWR